MKFFWWENAVWSRRGLTVDFSGDTGKVHTINYINPLLKISLIHCYDTICVSPRGHLFGIRVKPFSITGHLLHQTHNLLRDCWLQQLLAWLRYSLHLCSYLCLLSAVQITMSIHNTAPPSLTIYTVQQPTVIQQLLFLFYLVGTQMVH